MTQTLETDLLVIGGGATGGGIAWDAALRGLRVVLVDMGDLATGTSGRYHGLLHSGGRYAVRDPESARECIDENMILRKIVPQALEDTGGYFVLCPDDDESYADRWLEACRQAGISTQAVSLEQARKREPMLNPRMKAVYEVPDGTCDSWDLLHALQQGAEAAGAKFLTYHRVTRIVVEQGKVTGAQLENVRTGELLTVTCRAAVNAAGPWAKDVAALADCHFSMRLSRGAMLAFNIRWVNTVINRLRLPGDGDIFVPVGTVSVTGTTSVRTDDPGDTRVEPWEVQRILSETEPMTPGISRARILRAWGGVRPLYDGSGSEGRDVKRTFTLLDHADEGAGGFYSVVGGKLTTFRLMAERAVDAVCSYLNVTTPCTTASTLLPTDDHGGRGYHQLKGRLDALEHRHNPGALICECEIVTDTQIREALAEGSAYTLHDLRRDLRLGMGPCQGGFCAYRAAAVRHAAVHDTPANTVSLLGDFVERRVGGMKPLLWGHNLRQVLLNEHIYGRILGLMPSPSINPTLQRKDLPGWKSEMSASVQPMPRVIVVGAGLAGLTAALAALEMGAAVEVIAQGQGALTLHPGWLELGNVEELAARPEHPYARAASHLGEGLSLLDQYVKLADTGGAALTGLGMRRHAAFGAGIMTAPIRDRDRLLIVGVSGWRDFYPELIVDNLRAQGFEARALSIELPHAGGNFDDWPIDFAHLLDSDEGKRRLLEQVVPQLGDATVVAFPAILGFDRRTRDEISRAIGRTVIEIPTLTPSVPGLRLYRALRHALLERNVRFTIGPRVSGLAMNGGRVSGVLAETSSPRPRTARADAVILATGGLFGGGLESDYKGMIREPVTDTSIADVPPLSEWFSEAFTSGAAQPIHRVGLRTDAALRLLNAQGEPLAMNLFACGRLLPGYSPVAEACTEGVDIATGMLAARSAVEFVRQAVAKA